MRLTENELRETIRSVILESTAEKLLNLPQSPTPMEVYQSVMQWMGSVQDPRRDSNAGLVDRVIENVMVKHQVSKNDPIIGQKLNMLRLVLDPDLGRRQAYRRGVEAEMRELDPTGAKQKWEGQYPSSLRAGR